VVLRQRADGHVRVDDGHDQRFAVPIVVVMMMACGYPIEFALSQLTIAHVHPVCLSMKIIPQAKRVPPRRDVVM
jgi:hypothetical protein